MKSFALLVLATAVSILVPQAKADTLLNFTITGGATASGSFRIGTPYTCNFYTVGYAPIISMTGTFDGSPVKLLDPGPQDCNMSSFNGDYASTEYPGTCCFLVNNAPPIFSAGGSHWAIYFQDLGAWNNDPGFLFIIANLSAGGAIVNPAYMSFSESTVSTPEPATGLLLITGLFLYLVSKKQKEIQIALQ
jgi:hypothetical protein